MGTQTSNKSPALPPGDKAKALIVDDDAGVRLALKKYTELAGFEVATAGSGIKALERIERETPDIVLLDIRLPDADGLALLSTIKETRPDIRVIMITGHAHVQGAVEAMKAGAFDYLEKPIDFDRVKEILGMVSVGASASPDAALMDDMICESERMREVARFVEHLAAKPDLTILILGETGTGKNFLARKIHDLSPRKDKSFVEIVCSGIPDHLVESELFGYEKGAFTDAKADKKGLVEAALGGTLFLDEIGDMPYQLQSKLLTLIDERRYRRIGGLRAKSADVRIIAATNRDLYELAQSNRFRLDLYYRLKVATIELPPLSQRKEDFPLLVRAFIDAAVSHHRTGRKEISPDALMALQDYSWPGNVRELKNTVEMLVIFSAGDTIGLGDVTAHLNILRSRDSGEAEGAAPSPGGLGLKEAEEDLIRKAMEKMHGNQRKAAQLLGISRDTLRYRMKKLGIRSSDYRSL